MIEQVRLIAFNEYRDKTERVTIMKIALINENSQAAKNAMICETLRRL